MLVGKTEKLHYVDSTSDDWSGLEFRRLGRDILYDRSGLKKDLLNSMESTFFFKKKVDYQNPRYRKTKRSKTL